MKLLKVNYRNYQNINYVQKCKNSIESAAASVDTRGYCTTTFVQQLAAHQIPVYIVHTEHNSDTTKAPKITFLRVANATQSTMLNMRGQHMSPDAELWCRADFIDAGIINLCFKSSLVKKRTIQLCPA